MVNIETNYVIRVAWCILDGHAGLPQCTQLEPVPPAVGTTVAICIPARTNIGGGWDSRVDARQV